MIKFNETNTLEDGLLLLHQDGTYSGKFFDEHGKVWCDGFRAGVEYMQDRSVR